MTTMTLEEVHDILTDIAGDLDLDAQSMLDTIDNEAFEKGWEIMPEGVTASIAARLIAVAVADDLLAADEDALEDAEAHMNSNDGWQFENHNVVLWLECNGDGSESVVVWLGNERDRDMSAIGRAVIA